MNRRSFALSSLGLLVATALPARHVLASAAIPAVEALDARAFNAARRFLKTGFGDIAYVERGQGPAALFLHGFPLNGFQWRGQLERLSPWRRCLAPDFLGLGYTRVRAGQSLARRHRPTCWPPSWMDWANAMSISSPMTAASPWPSFSW